MYLYFMSQFIIEQSTIMVFVNFIFFILFQSMNFFVFKDCIKYKLTH